MPQLRVTFGADERQIEFAVGQSLKEVLDATDLRVRSGCGGNGACGLCRIRVVKGASPAPTAGERHHLGPEDLARGVRLACQIRPAGDIRAVIEDPAPPSGWKALSDADLPAPSGRPLGREAGVGRYGIALDLGTTQIRMALWDLKEGRRLATRSGLNSQARLGADVLTRLAQAAESTEAATTLSSLVRLGVAGGLADIFERDFLAGTQPGDQVGRLAVVGNTPMLALLAGRNFELLLEPAYWMAPVDVTPPAGSEWRAAWKLPPSLEVGLVSPLAGFVGSDLLAGVLATGLTDGPEPSLLVDFGTNTEIALWDGKVLWVTSAAGGPAFEGSGISCGMPAEPGAVCRIEARNGTRTLTTLGGGEPRGLCGSGLIDAIALLRRSGELARSGRFAADPGPEGLAVAPGLQHLRLGKGDVDVFQRAKAAVAAGIGCLLEQAGTAARDLERVVVTGAFGRYLRVTGAQELGLLPAIVPEKVETPGNAALAGCEMLLLAPDMEAPLATIRARSRLINLALMPDFEDRFIESLLLSPME